MAEKHVVVDESPAEVLEHDLGRRQGWKMSPDNVVRGPNRVEGLHLIPENSVVQIFIIRFILW